MGSSQLREGDVDLMLRVIEDGRHDDPGEKMPWALLEGLQALIPCDLGVSYQHHDYLACHTLVIQGVEGEGLHDGPDYAGPAGQGGPFWQLWWTSKCSYPQRAGDLVSVVHTGDFFATERDRLADPLAAADRTTTTWTRCSSPLRTWASALTELKAQLEETPERLREAITDPALR